MYCLMYLFKIKKYIISILNRLNTKYIIFKYCPKKIYIYYIQILFKTIPAYWNIFFSILLFVQ